MTTMTEAELTELILERLNTAPTSCSVNYSPGFEGTSERERLLFVFNRRLNRLKELDELSHRQRRVLQEITDFISELESMIDDEKLYSWKAIISGKNWGGWCTRNKIVFALQSAC